MCPPGGLLLNTGGDPLGYARMVCHCLLIETESGVVIVDTGLGLEDIGKPRDRLGRSFTLFARPRLIRAETALSQVEALGLRASDVRHILLTHLDVDHAGGLSDFPHASVHVTEEEHDAAMHPRTAYERTRYRKLQWEHGPKWVLHRDAGERWFGFDAVRPAGPLPPEVLVIPLAGHTRGHAAIAIKTEDGWLMHAGDAYYYHGEMSPGRRRCTPLLSVFQRLGDANHELRVQNIERLRALARDHASEVRVFCAHDPVEFDRLKS